MNDHPSIRDSGDRSSGDRPAVAIVGAGVCGLGVAWRLAAHGAHVTVFDKGAAGQGASYAAAGMLAACVEAEPGEDELVALCRESQRRWPAFAQELLDATGIDVELRTEGTMVLALNADDQAQLHHHFGVQKRLGLPTEMVSAADARRREPMLAGRLAGAIWSPQDHQVENRKLTAALRAACAARGVVIQEYRAVRDIVVTAGRATGVTLADGEAVVADAVLLAAGAWSRQIGLPAEIKPPVRPIKGQLVALQMDPAAPLLRHVVWAPGIYMVPRRDGRLILGATVEEKGFDDTMTAGGVLTLLDAAWRALPALEELPIAEMWVGFRPGSRDDAPILGATPIDGLFYATGHHRNGILLTPVTADAVATAILGGATDPAIAPFGIERFALARAAE